ncbi:glycosyltransferase [Azospirillum sp. ST 5-10]|uniref:glycosyltransferase n=1 Tax=unclassified Azospirillum TaxID=2630922 RepID=UPI003F49E6B5
MPLLEGDAQRRLYEDVLDGRRKLVGWGAISSFVYYCLQAPVMPEWVIDTDPEKWGTSLWGVPIVGPDRLRAEDPNRVALMVFPYYDAFVTGQILEAVAEYGDFPTIPPFRIEEDGPMVLDLLRRRMEDTGRHGGAAECQRIGALLRNWAVEELGGLVEALRDSAARDLPPPVPRRARLITSRLQPGGAERQMTYLAEGLKRQGWDVSLITFAPPSAGAEHYAADLERAGIHNRIMPSAREAYATPQPTLPADIVRIAEVLRRLPLPVAHPVAMAYRELAADRPELVVCYLDLYNVTGGLAAAMAGAPHVLLSGRNLNPTYFPSHYGYLMRWLADYYRILTRFAEVRLSANSGAGGRSYAEWLDLPASEVTVIANGVPREAAAPVPAEATAGIRAELGGDDGTPLVVGAFRLSDEKQPLLFIEVAARLRRLCPDVRVALVGDGPLMADVKAAVAAAGLERTLTLLGVRQDVRAVIAAGDLLLHTALAEGQPNVLLEAQLLGVPIVCTDAGGTRECLAPVLHGGIRAVDDADGLVGACVATLEDLARARRAAAAAGSWVADRFSVERMVANSLSAAGVKTSATSTARPFAESLP